MEQLKRSILLLQQHLSVSPKARINSILQRGTVQSSTAWLWNLIMMNLQVARVSVRKMEERWIITVKLMWNTMKMPQAKEY